MNRVYQSADECDDSTKRKNGIRFAARSQQFELMSAQPWLFNLYAGRLKQAKKRKL